MVVLFSTIIAAKGPGGFNGALWGDTPEKVRTSAKASSWTPDNTTAKGFPAGMTISAFQATDSIAGYKASIRYYFYNNKFFQATVTFNFDDMKKYDFNYNVYRSVNEYYNYIRSKTLVFTDDIYKLLLQKYGKKEPVFEGLNPRYMFINIDKYLNQERWNLRYHPYDYYTKIVTAAYARWDFPETRVTFSIAINAKDKRFDYQLSLISLDTEKTVRETMDSLRMKGL
jgi:hypothetical protein